MSNGLINRMLDLIEIVCSDIYSESSHSINEFSQATDNLEAKANPFDGQEPVAWAHYAKVGGNWFLQWPTYHREKDAIDALAEYGKEENVVVIPLYAGKIEDINKQE